MSRLGWNVSRGLECEQVGWNKKQVGWNRKQVGDHTLVCDQEGPAGLAGAVFAVGTPLAGVETDVKQCMSNFSASYPFPTYTGSTCQHKISRKV